jgi:hypothetical protein
MKSSILRKMSSQAESKIQRSTQLLKQAEERANEAEDQAK